MDGEVREVDGREIAVSSLEKVFFPEVLLTKGDLLNYYERIAPVMLPHAAGRFISMHRWPDGLDGDDFYQKDVAGQVPDWIETARVVRRGGGTIRQVVLDGPAALVYLAQLGCVTPHLWLSRADAPERPDRLVFDFDPPGGGEDAFGEVRRAARACRRLLAELGMESWVMLSGSRGLHVYSVLDGSADFGAAKSFARRVARLMVLRDPERLTVEQRKRERRGRIFIDYLRNGYAQTTVSPYAVRALPSAPVATPLDWSELGRTGMRPRRYTVRTVFRRLGATDDPWAEMVDHPGADIAEAGSRLEALEADEAYGHEARRRG